tara:strand:+ start:2199 stop:3674 length:1476 start_codon:yes stop_codon:yes gene_type:complete
MITSSSTYNSKEYLIPFNIVPTRRNDEKKKEKPPFFSDLLHTSNGEQTGIKDLMAFQIPAFTAVLSSRSKIMTVVAIAVSACQQNTRFGSFSALCDMSAEMEQETEQEQAVFIRNCLKKATYAPVGSFLNKQGTRKPVVNKQVRTCHRVTFGKKVVAELAVHILPAIKYCTGLSDEHCFLDPTHADILDYEEGGVFQIHRDKVNPFPTQHVDVYGVSHTNVDDGRWRMYTVIIGLDSNLNSVATNDDGNTCVYLPGANTAVTWEINGREFSPMSDSQRQLTPHLFAEGCINGGMVVFPAESFHSSRKITQHGGYKLALKLDAWLYIKPPSQDITHQVATNGEGYHNLKMVFNKQQCRCKLCQPAILAAMGLAKELYHILPETLPFSVLKNIANFTVPTLGQFKHHDCGCKEAYYNKWNTDLGEEKDTPMWKRAPTFHTTPEMCKCTCPLCSFSYTCHGSWVESWEGYCEDNYNVVMDEDEDRNGYCNGYDY